jgi:hypothetical protein
MLRWTVCVLAALACGCSDSTAPPSALIYSLNLWHGPLWAITGPATSANRGDTIAIQIDLTDSTTVGGTPATVRAICALNVSILHAGTLVTSLPSPITCPDSTYQLSIGPAYSSTWISRFYNWVIPLGLSPGTYTIRGEVLVQPALSVSRTLQVN